MSRLERRLYCLLLPILVPKAGRFLVTWSGNEGLWKQPLPDVRKFLISGRACAEVTNITAHAQNGFLSLTAPLGEKFYFLSSFQRVASLECFENAPLHLASPQTSCGVCFCSSPFISPRVRGEKSMRDEQKQTPLDVCGEATFHSTWIH